MNSISRSLEKHLQLSVNRAKSAVARPWERKFLGYSLTGHKQAKLKIGASSVSRLKEKSRSLTTGNCSKALKALIDGLAPVLRGWISYFRLTEIKGILEELDGWIRRKLRCLMWRHWKKLHKRARMLMKGGLSEERAWISATNQRGPWWNSGARHLNQALPKKIFDRAGLLSLLELHRQFQSCK